MPVKKLVVTMAVPMMISMLVQALYNVVDSIFVSQISQDALTAVTLAFPIQNLIIAVGSGTGVGINALLSRSLGAKNYEETNAAANTGILLNLIHYLIFLCIGLFGARPFILSQTRLLENADQIAAYGTTYLSIVSIFSIGVFVQITMERLLQATGRTNLSMITQLTGAIFNIIFDPILIFGLFGFPKMGVAGAAVATVLGQMVAAVVGLYLNVKKNTEIQISLKRVLHPQRRTVVRLYQIGIPSILMVSIGSVMTYAMNLILQGFSKTAIAVFGAYFKLQSFFFMPVFGLNNGVVPILAYNYGAGKKDRIYEAIGFSIRFAFCVMLAGTVIFMSVPQVLLGMFSADADMLSIGVPALRIISIHFPLAAVGIALSGVLQAFGKSIYSMYVSLARQLIVLIPVAWLLSKTGVLNSVWWCFLIAEVVSLVLSYVFFRKVKREIIEQI